MKWPRPGGSSVCSCGVTDQVTAPCFPVLPARGALPLPRPSQVPRAAPYLPGPSTPHSRGLPHPGREGSPDPLFEVRGVTSFTFMPCPQLVCARYDRVLTLLLLAFPSEESRGGRDRHLALRLGHPACSEGCGTLCSESVRAHGRVSLDFRRIALASCR